MPLSSTFTPKKNNWSPSLLCKPTISQCGIGIIRQSKEINGFSTEGIWYLGSEWDFNKILNIQRQIKYFKIQLLLTMMPLPWLLVSFPAPPSSWQGRPWTACPWGRNYKILWLIFNGSVTNSDSLCIISRLWLAHPHLYHLLHLWDLSISTYSWISLLFSMVSLVLTFLWISSSLSSNQSTCRYVLAY